MVVMVTCIYIHNTIFAGYLPELNAQDKQGNTPLHVAVKVQQTASIDFLVQHGADSTILNDDSLAPIHLAVELNAVKSLKVCNFSSLIFNIGSKWPHCRRVN